MASDNMKTNMDGRNLAGELGDFAAAGVKQANLKLAQQFMALAQSNSTPDEAQVIEGGHTTIGAPQDNPNTQAIITEDQPDFTEHEYPYVFGILVPTYDDFIELPPIPDRRPFDPGLPRSPLGTFEILDDGSWTYTPHANTPFPSNTGQSTEES